MFLRQRLRQTAPLVPCPPSSRALLLTPSNSSVCSYLLLQYPQKRVSKLLHGQNTKWLETNRFCSLPRKQNVLQHFDARRVFILTACCCSNSAINQRFIDYIETSKKRSHTASCSNNKPSKSSAHSWFLSEMSWCICSVTRTPEVCMQHTIGRDSCCDFWRHFEGGGQNLMKVENVERVRALIWLDKASDPAFSDSGKIFWLS